MNTFIARSLLPRWSRKFGGLFVSIVIVLAAWAGQAAAETKTGLYVYPAGNIGNGWTSGWSCSGVTCINAASTTSFSIYSVAVNARHWHLGALEYQRQSVAHNTNYSGLVSFSYATWESTTSKHSFMAGQNFPVYDYYTSYADNSASTYSWWYCGNSSC